MPAPILLPEGFIKKWLAVCYAKCGVFWVTDRKKLDGRQPPRLLRGHSGGMGCRDIRHNGVNGPPGR